MGECAGKDLHKRLQNKLAAKAIFGDKLIIFLHFPGFKTSCVNLATVAFPPLEILREERLKRWLLEREKFFIRKDKILKNNHPCSGSLSYALPATNVVSPSSHSLLTKLTQPSMTFPKPNTSKCAF